MPPHPFLHLGTVAPSMARKYRKAVTFFLHWARAHSEDPQSPSDLDVLLSEYIHDLYLTRRKRFLVADALYGLIWLLPHLHGSLRLSARCIEGWGRLMPSVSFPPMSRAVAVAASLSLLKSRLPVLALGVLVAFDGYLRVGELLSLRLADVALPAAVSPHLRRVSLRLRHTKSGPNRFVALRCPQTISLVTHMIGSRSRSCFTSLPRSSGAL
jgi:integrase